ncbi:MAG TPA: SDR family oxidoreductase [Actinophytocola sp.]|uniref:SDR family oxidoreductase n=1 Tax=Actinophytocola sp. TaxID=1872138 RepID=UPI002E00ECB6|nr:SDR family oxidoreductase [Actinophytocola sp.]
MSDLSGGTTIVVGASRGLGHGIAIAFAQAGAPVVAVSRTAAEFPDFPGGSGSIRSELADGGEAAVPARLIDRYDPRTIILVGGATPQMRPLHEQTWETFSIHWESDVRIAFHWLREALLKPLAPGSKVITVSSGAALGAGGSPLSGGYVGAKATQRFITGYAQFDSDRAGLDITFSTIFPKFAPTTGVGRAAIPVYAAASGLSEEEFLRPQGPLVTPEIAGKALVELAQANAAAVAPAYLLNGTGLHEI